VVPNLNRFRDGLLGLAIGADADTTAAIYVQLASAYDGQSGIPLKWLERLFMRAEISSLAGKLAELEFL
jgi:ADP-ribosyl-[dinitrogen reductase] hydrolase